MNIDPHHFHFLPVIGGMVRNAETGEIRWPVVAGGIITAALVGTGGWIVGLSREVSVLHAKQEMAMMAISRLEASQHPATMKRYTADDADRDRAAVERTIVRMEERILRLEQRRGGGGM